MQDAFPLFQAQNRAIRHMFRLLRAFSQGKVGRRSSARWDGRALKVAQLIKSSDNEFQGMRADALRGDDVTGEGMESADDEDAVEREVMLDRNAPRFGEQAQAPLKVRCACHPDLRFMSCALHEKVITMQLGGPVHAPLMVIATGRGHALHRSISLSIPYRHQGH